jgi:lysophospholipase L1-like esterase
MAGRIFRLLSALVAGMVFALFWGGLTHGVGHGLLGLAQEPRDSFAPFRWAPVPPQRPLRVLLLGTSLTAQGDWPDALQARLAACHPGGAEVTRLARAGANSAWGAKALQDWLAQRSEPGSLPDALVVEFSINDASLWRGLTLANSTAQHRSLLEAAARAGLPVWLATMNPAFGRKAWMRPGQIAYRALYHDLAKAYGTGLVALAPAWLALSAPARRDALPDGLHPSGAAMTALTAPALAKALSAAFCP